MKSKIENVYFCSDCALTRMSVRKTLKCSECKTTMELCGFTETRHVGDDTESPSTDSK